MIEKMIHPAEKGYRWFVFVSESGHVLAQGYHTSPKVAGNQMDTAFLYMIEEWSCLNGA